MARFSGLAKATISRNYLQTNSTTHEFLFGAMAELVDNSRDANAKSLEIYTQNCPDVRGGYYMCFLDDGIGMSPKEASSVFVFGRSYKKDQNLNLIGQYGNGLKSGSMRIGNDLIFFTKKDEIQTICLLSQTFLNDNDEEEIICPMPSFYKNFKPCLEERLRIRETNSPDMKTHNLEMDLIKEYSPFHTDKEIMAQFEKIKGDHGTLVICYNIKLISDGKPEFDIETDPYDIRMNDLRVDYTDRKSQEVHCSFRAYASILYHNPRMKIYIQDKKVRTKILERSLYFPVQYRYVSKKFNARTEKEKKLIEEKIGKAEQDFRDKTSDYTDYRQKYNKKSHSECSKLERLKRDSESAYSYLQQCKLEKARINASFNQPKTLNFIFGVNIENRSADGLFVYNCSRLILMHEPTKQQMKSNEYRGIIGVVDVPRLVLEPTHNKQHFVDNREEKFMISEIGNFMEQYLKELRAHVNKPISLDFWSPFGYSDMDFRFLPSDDDKFRRIRMQKTTQLVQCDRKDCLKWRIIAWNRRNLDPSFPSDKWICENNPEQGKNSCRFQESLNDIEVKELIRTNDEIMMNESRSRAAQPSSQSRVFSNSNKKKRGSFIESESDFSEVENNDTKRRDPDFRSRGVITKKKKHSDKTYDDQESESVNRSGNTNATGFQKKQIRSIFETHIIEPENYEPINRIKKEPIRIDESNANASPRDSSDITMQIGHDYNEDSEIQQSLVITSNYRDLLVTLAQEIDNSKLANDFKICHDSDLAQFPIQKFFKTYQQKKREIIDSEIKRIINSNRASHLSRLKLFYTEKESKKIIDCIYNSNSSPQKN